jgi:histidinol-phosphate/aromatic aminotransferase/cobyric acid decarboxylase-like protein
VIIANQLKVNKVVNKENTVRCLRTLTDFLKIVLLKSPNSTNPTGEVLTVAVLVAIAEVLAPSSVEIELGRTPIVGTTKGNTSI